MRIGVAIAAVSLVVALVTLYWAGQWSSYSENVPEKENNKESVMIAEKTIRESPIVPSGQDSIGSAEESEQLSKQLSVGDEKPILGQKVRLREIRAGGELVNLEFVIRRGILPRRLFTDETRKILRYDELHYNNVGYGAVTVWLLYQLESETGVDVAVSRPDGSDFQILVAGLEKVTGFEHFPAQNRVSLEVEERGSTKIRSLRLPVN